MKLLENRAFGKSLIKGTRGFAPRDETFPKFQAPANQAFGKGLSEIFDQAFFQKACFDKTFSKSFKDLPFICSLLSPAGFVISPENQLIKTCARSWATKEEIERSLRPDLDWDYILDIAIQENIAPLLFYNLEKVSDGLVAPGTMEYLRVIYFAIAKQNLLASYRLGEILRSLSGTDINVIVLKGMALAKTVYQDIAPRPFGDIDLLVHRRDINKVESKLLQLGYILSSGEHVSFANQFGAALRYKNNGVMPVDLHWYVIELPYSKYIDTNSFWEDTVCIDIEGVNALVFSPENLLIHLCLHVIKEHYSQILWLVDIAEVIHRYGNILDWELVQKKSEQYRINMLIYQVLNTLDELFAVPIPISVQECSGRFKSSSFEARLFGALADLKLTRHERMGIARFLNLYRTRFKIKRVLDEFLPDRDFMSKKYPRKKICISYYTRVQLAFRMVFGFIRALSRL